MRIPQRQSLVTETLNSLLESIQAGEWDRLLPGERHLCERLQVSRLTLRQALKHLEDEGFLRTEQGKRRRIIKQARGKGRKKKALRIGYLSPRSSLEMPGYYSRSIAAMEHHIHRNGGEFQIFSRPGCYNYSPGSALGQLMEESGIQYWIAQQTNRDMQQWFDRNGVKLVISGTRFEDVNLPYIDLDNAAVCRHAVGLFAARKRRSICYLAETMAGAGDFHSENGFIQGVEASGIPHSRVVRSDGSPEGVRQKLDAIFAAKHLPDAILVDKSSHAFTTVGYLLQRGLRVPQDVAVICRTESIDFPYVIPTVAHYSRNIPEIAKRTAEMALKMARGKPLEAKGTLLIPDFVPGNSI